MRTLVYGLALAATLGLQSCDGAARLAENVAGPWTGSPEVFYDDATSHTTIVETYTFNLSDDKSNGAGGQLILTAQLASDGLVPGTDVNPAPREIEISARATATGSWQATDDDEIMITINTKSINVEVDPSDVVVSAQSESGEKAPVTGTATPMMIKQIQKQFAQALQIRYMAPIKLDDVKINANTMSYEINDLNYTMQR